MATFTSPSGREYQWNNPNPPTKEDIDALVAYDAQLGQQQPQAGSQQALNQAVQQSASVGEMRRREGMGEIAAAKPSDGGMLSKALSSIGKSGLYPGDVAGMGGEYVPMVSEPGTIQYGLEQAERRKGMATGLRIGSIPATIAVAPQISLPALGRAAPFVAESILGMGSEAAAQMVQPEEVKPFEIIASGVPGIPAGQAKSVTRQVLREVGAGAGVAAAQTGIESLGRDIDTGEFLARTGLGGLLYPAAATAGRTAVAGVKARGVFKPEFVAEFRKPFVQEFVRERASKIRSFLEQSPSSELRADLADSIAEALYSPGIAGATDPQKFKDSVKSFISDSIISGKRSGLSSDEINSAIKSQLSQVVQDADARVGTLIGRLIKETDQAVKQATDAVDQSVRNPMTNLARRAEGRLTLESEKLNREIDGLKVKLASIPETEATEAKRIKQNISNLQQQIDDIESGAERAFPAGAGISREELGTEAREKIQKEIEQFRRERNEGYAALRPELQDTKISIETQLPDGTSELREVSVEQLRQERSRILKQIDFSKPVQKGAFSSFQRLEDINQSISTALDSNPALKAALNAENAAYREGISRFKGSFVDRIAREIGEEGGAPEIIAGIAGPSGGTNLKNLKRALGDRWPEIEPKVKAYVFTQIRGDNPNDFIDAIASGRAGMATGIQKSVIEDLFPDISEIQKVASKYNDTIAKKASALAEQKELSGVIKKLTGDVEAGISGAEKQLKEAQAKYDSSVGKIEKLKQSKLASSDEQQIVDALSGISADMKWARSRGDFSILGKDDVVRALSEKGGKAVVSALDRAVKANSVANDRFNTLIRKAVAPGGELESVNPTALVQFLKRSTPETYDRTSRFVDAMRKGRPELVGDAQDMFIGQLVSDSFDGKTINSSKMLEEASKPENARVVQQLFGKDGQKRISRIAEQIGDISKMGDTVFNKMILSAIGSIIGYKMYGGVGMATGGLGGYAAYTGATRLMRNAVESAMGKLLKNPEYIRRVSAPIDAATKTQLDWAQNMFPKILNQEYQRLQMAEESEKDSEESGNQARIAESAAETGR
jgi:hypothetical protein